MTHEYKTDEELIQQLNLIREKFNQNSIIVWQKEEVSTLDSSDFNEGIDRLIRIVENVSNKRRRKEYKDDVILRLKVRHLLTSSDIHNYSERIMTMCISGFLLSRTIDECSQDIFNIINQYNEDTNR